MNKKSLLFIIGLFLVIVFGYLFFVGEKREEGGQEVNSEQVTKRPSGIEESVEGSAEGSVEEGKDTSYEAPGSAAKHSIETAAQQPLYAAAYDIEISTEYTQATDIESASSGKITIYLTMYAQKHHQAEAPGIYLYRVAFQQKPTVANQDGSDVVVDVEWSEEGYVKKIKWLDLAENHPFRDYISGVLWSMSHNLLETKQLQYTLSGTTFIYQYYPDKLGVVRRTLIKTLPAYNDIKEDWVLYKDNAQGLLAVERVDTMTAIKHQVDSTAINLQSDLSIQRLDNKNRSNLFTLSNTEANQRWQKKQEAQLSQYLSKINNEGDLRARLAEFLKASSHELRNAIGTYLAENYSVLELEQLLQSLSDADQATVVYALAYAKSDKSERLLSQLATSLNASDANVYRSVLALGDLPEPSELTVDTLSGLAFNSAASTQDISNNSLIQLGRVSQSVGDLLKDKIVDHLDKHTKDPEADQAILFYAKQATSLDKYIDEAIGYLNQESKELTAEISASSLLSDKALEGNAKALAVIKQKILESTSQQMLENFSRGLANETEDPALTQKIQERAITTNNEVVRAMMIQHLSLTQARCDANRNFLLVALNEQAVSENIKQAIQRNCRL